MALGFIKTEAEYEAALARASSLMDAEPNSPQSKELELLAFLIEKYEDETAPMGMPSVPGAIKFRMEQLDLRPKDLIPIIGSAARVSEVLAGKRELTMKMARSLHHHLGIPAEVLLQREDAEFPEEGAVDWTRFPIPAMAKAGWFGNITAAAARERAEELIRGLFARAGNFQPALLRAKPRSKSEMDAYALSAWQARALEIASQHPLPIAFEPGKIDEAFIREAVRLSYFDQGPSLVREFLAKSGIHFVVLNHLPRTHLDGAAMKATDGNPIVVLTLRHDRLDNFWFSLAHELAHVALHLYGEEDGTFFDDFDVMGDGLDPIEKAADDLAEAALIPTLEWVGSAVSTTRHPRDARRLAARLRISPAIVAGRVRYENKDYRALTMLVGHGEVRKHFGGAAMGE